MTAKQINNITGFTAPRTLSQSPLSNSGPPLPLQARTRMAACLKCHTEMTIQHDSCNPPFISTSDSSSHRQLLFIASPFHQSPCIFCVLITPSYYRSSFLNPFPHRRQERGARAQSCRGAPPSAFPSNLPLYGSGGLTRSSGNREELRGSNNKSTDDMIPQISLSRAPAFPEPKAHRDG
ncbi:hypothetical protein ASPVEDRAFT_503951 [Aspergillus versicolor CBS 583.65]|uniref:Uncharacterized protein n=1 Tax=Aspergillus versicolor CBS 583.65 TaxID=1036611 RepID=A0A1L9PCB3_ASPVE|nr:uncharacterized protein ASPVEDRAFT_503951 [Aspergillus versicolor CBS 583.65]OJI99169.1 hypothetical protein ASPVEDRAFT_503951 [Aspergillus versicolor CBS 583.65]